MAFRQGQKRPAKAGRKKGTPNKATNPRNALVREILENNGINLVDRIIELLPYMEEKDQAKTLLGLMPYVYPRLSAMHHTIDTPAPEKNVGPKSFEEFCEAANYPTPYLKQVEMFEFGMQETETRLLLGSRGYGKTDYVVILGIAYQIYLDPQFSSLIVTKSRERNAAILGEIGQACALNGVKFEKENQSCLRLEGLHGKDHSVSAVTIGAKSIRGRHPKLIVMDDPVTEDDVSEATRRKVQRIYNELFKLCKNILIIGQPVHKYDLYEILRPVLKKLEVPYGSIPELDHDLEAQRLAGVSEESIQASYFLKVVSESASPFEKIKYLPDFPQGGDAVMFIDPSFTGGDFTGTSIVKAHFQGVAVQGNVYKRAWNHCIDEILADCEKRGVKKICFECNSLGDQPVILLRSHPVVIRLGIGVVGKISTGNKHARIMAAGEYAHLIHLSRTSGRIYIDQTVKYEYGAKNDDGPDSLAGAMQWIGLIKGKS